MGRGGGILTRWQGGARFKVDSHSVYQLFLQDTGKKKKKRKERVPEKIGGIPNVIFPFLCFAFRWAIEDNFSSNSVLSSGCNAEIVERQ